MSHDKHLKNRQSHIQLYLSDVAKDRICIDIKDGLDVNKGSYVRIEHDGLKLVKICDTGERIDIIGVDLVG